MLRIGIDLGGTKIEGIALDETTEVGRLRLPTPREDYAATLAAIARIVRELEQRVGGRAAVGVGIPGTCATETGLVKNANSAWLIGRPLAADLEHALGRPVRIANDANCFAMSEAVDGAAMGAGVVFAAILGTGVGAGIVVDGRLLTGPNGIAGEWGHNPLPWARAKELPGSPCYCGKRGCIETFLSGPALTREYESRARARVSAGEIVARAEGGDPEAQAVLEEYEDRLARALASIINVLDPDVIVLGGGLSNVDRLYRNVPPAWPLHVFGAIRRGDDDASGEGRRPAPVRTRLARAAHGDSSGVRGAAWLWAVTA